jgi:hypothetical protein
MSLISDWLSKNVFGEIRKAADDLFTSDEERKILDNALVKIEKKSKLELARLKAKEDEETTKRWLADNKSGWLSKNVRPAGLVFLLSVLTIMAFFDGNVGGFQIKPAYISLFQSLAITAFLAYYGSRGWEKIKGVAK